MSSAESDGNVWTLGDGSPGPRRWCVEAGRRLLAVFLGFVVAASAVAQPARVDAIVLADSVRVGEPFTLALVAEHSFNTEVLFPAPDAGPVLFGDLEVIERTDGERRYLGAARPGTRVDSVAYTVRTFALDSARVPALPVRVVAGDDTILVGSPSQRIPVISVVGPDAQALRDLAPLASFPQPLWPWVLLAVATLGLVGLLAYWWWTRHVEPPEPPPHDAPPEVDVDAYDEAVEALARLAAMDVADDDAMDPFYVALSSLLRRYLAQRLDLRVLERTTREVVEDLEGHGSVPSGAARRVRAVLELADLVKFAEARPAPSDADKALRETRAAIEAIEDRASPTATIVEEVRRDDTNRR